MAPLNPSRPPTADPWLVRPQPRPRAALRLFCFPHAGGGAIAFRSWPDGLPPSVEVCPVQPPGRGNRLVEPAYTRLTTLVDATARALLPYLNKPFAFFGHSMGAMIGFELARLLRERLGLEPLHLFVSGRLAPHLPDTHPRTYDLLEPEFIEEWRRLSGTPEEVLENPELMHLLIPLLRADFEVAQTYSYTPGPPLGCPITAFGGLEDYDVTVRAPGGLERAHHRVLHSADAPR